MDTKKPTVLIVDDSPVNVEAVYSALGVEYDARFALSGAEALAIAAEWKPDLILLDVRMPEMDGYEVCSRLKSDTRTASIPVIFITGMDQQDDETKGLEIGAIDYITKPIRPAIVRARVRNHIELKRYRDLLEHYSMTDGLTRIANRRRFDGFLEREWTRATRNRGAIALIIADVDFFKSYNDHAGHQSGDECLKTVARVLQQSARRPTDLLARYGGEEFAFVLADTDLKGAITVAENAQKDLAAAAICHPASSVSETVTLSMGVAAMNPDRDTPTAAPLVAKADKNLYAAKERGRNRIVFDP